MNARRFGLIKIAGVMCSVAFGSGALAQTLPTTLGANTAGGVVSITSNGTLTTVTTNVARSVQEWSSFNVGAGKTIHFQQPNASSAILNRVTDPNPSTIAGSITSNGQVALINSAGILIQNGATIDTAAFIASTLNITNSDFINGVMKFDGTPNTTLVNQGSILTTTANPDGGSIYLIGTTVSNEGSLTVGKGGQIMLAAGESVTIANTATPGVSIEITNPTAYARNLGTITAKGGVVGLAGALVRNESAIDARGAVVTEEGGRIFLRAMAGPVELTQASNLNVNDGSSVATPVGKIALESTGADMVINGTVSAQRGEIKVAVSGGNLQLGTTGNSTQTFLEAGLVSLKTDTNKGIALQEGVVAGTTAEMIAGSGGITQLAAHAVTSNSVALKTQNGAIAMPGTSNNFGYLTLDAGAMGATLRSNTSVIAKNQTLNGAMTTAGVVAGNFALQSGGFAQEADAPVQVYGVLSLGTDTSNRIGNVSITHADNVITSLGNLWGTDHLKISDSTGGLNVTGTVDTNGTARVIDLRTQGGNLILASTASLQNLNASGYGVILATTNDFVNQGASVNAGASGKLMVFADNPDNATLGGLSGKSIYDCTLATCAPGAAVFTPINTGNIFAWVYKPTVTVTANNFNKTYGDSSPAVTFSYTGARAGDAIADVISGVTASGNPAQYANAGNYTLSGAGGISTLRYGITYATGTGTVSTRAVDVQLFGSKVYDGNTSYSGVQTSLSNVVNSDTVSIGNLGSVAFTSKNVSTNQAITWGALTVGNSNYHLGTVSAGTNALTLRDLTIGLTANSKTYDGTLVATGTLSSNKIAGDSLVLNTTGLSFASKTAETGKTVTANGLSLSGTDAGNYALINTTATDTADISKRSLTTTATGSNKAYDGTATASVVWSIDKLAGDTVSIATNTANFNDKHAGTGKLINASYVISGPDAGNYSFGSSTTTTGNITQASLVMDAVSDSRGYDGTTVSTATVNVGGLKSGDTVTGLSQRFDSKNAGTRTLLVNGGYLINDGNGGGNYLVTTSTATGTITPRNLSITLAADDKIYDGTVTATGTLTSNQIAGDALTLSAAALSFADKHAATGKLVTASGLSLSGTDAGNYTLLNVSATDAANITKRVLAVSAIGGSKTYDGTPSATVSWETDKITGDAVNVATTSVNFVDKHAATNKQIVAGYTISGADAGNYSFGTTANTTGTINKRPLTVTATATNKTYDGSILATAALWDDRVAGDALALGYAQAMFADKNAATDVLVTVDGIQVSGSDAGNYTWNGSTSAAANIAQRSLSITANAIKTEKGSPLPALTYRVNGLISGDVLVGALSTPADLDSEGNYPILLGTLTAGGNYLIGYQGNLIEVIPPTAKSDQSSSAHEVANAVMKTSASLMNDATKSSAAPGSTDSSLIAAKGSDQFGDEEEGQSGKFTEKPNNKRTTLAQRKPKQCS